MNPWRIYLEAHQLKATNMWMKKRIEKENIKYD